MLNLDTSLNILYDPCAYVRIIRQDRFQDVP